MLETTYVLLGLPTAVGRAGLIASFSATSTR